MAMMDYGAIAFKNGKLISTDMFTPMIDMVGWEDTEEDMRHNYYTNKDEPLNLKGNYFAYIGDKDITVAFYKCGLIIVKRYDDVCFTNSEYFNGTDYKWYKWVRMEGGWDDSDMVVTKRNGYYVFKWKYKGDRYKVYFGYGVDFYYYKKHHIVNYYRSLKYRMYEIKRWIKDVQYSLKFK